MVDHIDTQIMEMLQRNARMPFLEIAKQLEVSESTIRKRVKSLEEKGVITKYTAHVNPAKIGFGSVAYVGVDVQPEHFLHVAKKLTEFDQVKSVATCTGDHTLMTEIWMENGTELRSFIHEKIDRMQGVTRTCPAIVTESLKSY